MIKSGSLHFLSGLHSFSRPLQIKNLNISIFIDFQHWMWLKFILDPFFLFQTFNFILSKKPISFICFSLGKIDASNFL